MLASSSRKLESDSLRCENPRLSLFGKRSSTRARPRLIKSRARTLPPNDNIQPHVHRSSACRPLTKSNSAAHRVQFVVLQHAGSLGVLDLASPRLAHCPLPWFGGSHNKSRATSSSWSFICCSGSRAFCGAGDTLARQKASPGSVRDSFG